MSEQGRNRNALMICLAEYKFYSYCRRNFIDLIRTGQECFFTYDILYCRKHVIQLKITYESSMWVEMATIFKGISLCNVMQSRLHGVLGGAS